MVGWTVLGKLSLHIAFAVACICYYFVAREFEIGKLAKMINTWYWLIFRWSFELNCWQQSYRNRISIEQDCPIINLIKSLPVAVGWLLVWSRSVKYYIKEYQYCNLQKKIIAVCSTAESDIVSWNLFIIFIIIIMLSHNVSN